MQKMRFLFIYNLLLTVLRCTAIGTGYWIWDSPRISLMMFSGISIIFNVFLILMAFYWAGSDGTKITDQVSGQDLIPGETDPP